ncbi:Acyl-CoA reductase (LuxC) [Marinomonas aquimarina]|uniref:Acyl-CoA reductase (LuxC) n=1 Tax=Marinomonas aquimarina TaxID=295068 RepID=A0A1A8T2D7_9GAMM|nr:acyl-CoA reductase [Marinomonas aquimarina]SBS25468.1 Acyl-CoA reductase (LuxC) [Marinomonas aquimarina]
MSSNIRLWAGNSNFLHWTRTTVAAFSSERIAFLSTLSQRLLAGNYSAALKALGFWLRESQLRQWQQEYANDDKVMLAPVGRVLIVSPSNVEGLFAYSWALSYLMGNQTVVRVSEQLTDDQQGLFALLELLDKQSAGLSEQAFISYDKRSDWTQTLSHLCQLRMLWGSDQSIESIRQIVLPAQAQEWVFPDRYSVSVLHLTETDVPQLSKLAEGFARDVSTYQQQACASPKWVFWYQTDKTLQQQFWQAVDTYLVSAFPSNERLVASQYLCALGGTQIHHGNIHVIEASTILDSEQSLIGVVGQTGVADMTELAGLLPDNLQSVTNHGLEKENKTEIANRSNIRQFSALGQSLSFDLVWDGVDLFSLLSRRVRCY